MKNIRCFFLAFTALFMATAAHAQQTNVKAIVPFDFVVADRVYPAGEYSIKTIGEGDETLRIDNTVEARTNLVFSHACLQLAPSDTTKLVFHRVGDNYFLYQVWGAGNSEGREFPVSRTEIQIGQNRENPERIIVAANITH